LFFPFRTGLYRGCTSADSRAFGPKALEKIAPRPLSDRRRPERTGSPCAGPGSRSVVCPGVCGPKLRAVPPPCFFGGGASPDVSEGAADQNPALRPPFPRGRSVSRTRCSAPFRSVVFFFRCRREAVKLPGGRPNHRRAPENAPGSMAGTTYPPDLKFFVFVFLPFCPFFRFFFPFFPLFLFFFLFLVFSCFPSPFLSLSSFFLCFLFLLFLFFLHFSRPS